MIDTQISFYHIFAGTKKKKKTSNASKDSRLSIASSGSGEFVQTSALSQPLIFQPHSRPNTSAHPVGLNRKDEYSPIHLCTISISFTISFLRRKVIFVDDTFIMNHGEIIAFEYLIGPSNSSFYLMIELKTFTLACLIFDDTVP